MSIKGKYGNMVSSIKEQKELMGVVIGTVIALMAIIGWSRTEFVTTARGHELARQAKVGDELLAAQISQLSNEVKKSNDLVLVHMGKHELNDVIREIRENKTQTFNIQQFTRVNGMDPQSEIRLQQLETELSELTDRKNCIINNNQLCD